MIHDFAIITVKNFGVLVSREGLVITSDARLSDARPPLPHTHPVAEVLGAVSEVNPLWLLLGRVLPHLVTTSDGQPVQLSNGDMVWTNGTA